MKDTPVTYVIFDLLWLDGHSLMGLPYSERRELLGELRADGRELADARARCRGRARRCWRRAAGQGLEGVVAKRLDSTYQPGVRARGWVKVKSTGRQEFVVGGWLPGKGKRTGTIGALLLGVLRADGGAALRRARRQRLDERELERLSALLAPLEREDSPFTAGERPPREAMFCEPRLVVEVSSRTGPQDGSLRAPVYCKRACARTRTRRRSCARTRRRATPRALSQEHARDRPAVCEQAVGRRASALPAP